MSVSGYNCVNIFDFISFLSEIFLFPHNCIIFLSSISGQSFCYPVCEYFLAGYSELATPLLTSPIYVYFGGPRELTVTSRRAANLATHLSSYANHPS